MLWSVLCCAGCGDAVQPTDPLIGWWRSGEFETSYPTDEARARTVIELRFYESGRAERIIERRYPRTDASPYRGCTWVERHAQLQWLRSDRETGALNILPIPHARYSRERSECVDATLDRAPESFEDSVLDYLAATYRASVREPTLVLTTLGPVGIEPQVRAYTRVR